MQRLHTLTIEGVFSETNKDSGMRKSLADCPEANRLGKVRREAKVPSVAGWRRVPCLRLKLGEAMIERRSSQRCSRSGRGNVKCDEQFTIPHERRTSCCMPALTSTRRLSWFASSIKSAR